MIKFLINRPIAVLMAFLALVITGVITFFSLPVSLLPDIAIPHITVKISESDYSARELENVIVTPVRRQLMQINGLSEIKSETRDGSAIIKLTLDYGINTDLAFIEVNEKIDGAMNSLPKTANRPKAVKASATDIPVLFLHISSNDDRTDFLETGEIADEIVRRRLEQQDGIAMVDYTGIPERHLSIVPDMKKLQSLSMTVDDIRKALDENNVEPGSMTVRNGYYEYNVSVSNRLRTPDDVRNIKISKDGRIMELGELCDVETVESAPSGYSYHQGKRAVTLAVIKKASESMSSMEAAVDSTLSYFRRTYPEISFSKSRSQTKLLDFTISNLEQNLLLGLLLVFVVTGLFMKNGRLPFIVGITVITAVIMTFLLFFLFGISVNIISLAGLILAVGMMIDNSVIVAENITQYRQRGDSLESSCIKGTNEMITPMLSSSLTTVAVFVPLVFMSGIAGAIFADQAFSITAGLASSYITGITLLPVLYFLMMPKGEFRSSPGRHEITRWYDKGISFVFSHKKSAILFVVISALGAVGMFYVLRTERMPSIDSNEIVLNVDWNDNITLDENRDRVKKLSEFIDSLAVEKSWAIGMQDYLIGSADEKSAAESEIYLRVNDTDELPRLVDSLKKVFALHFPGAIYSFASPENIFEKVFSSDEASLEARLSFKNVPLQSRISKFKDFEKEMERKNPVEAKGVPEQETTEIILNDENLALYGVSSSAVTEKLRESFKGNRAGTLRSNNRYMPIVIGGQDLNLKETIDETLIPTVPDKDGNISYVPLRNLVRLEKGHDFRTITSDEGGEYVPLVFDTDRKGAERIMETVKSITTADRTLDVDFTGSLFSNSRMIEELTVILIISLLLMYFILCAQFESFIQPLVVLIEIPIDITFALLTLWIFGQTLNVMSAIGIIVTCGIVVNDSILKIDAINELRQAGYPMLEAVHIAGNRRLKAIIMTSITTILAMVPVLFTSDLGSELQRPLAIAMIGSMVVGTLVSIFIIPLLYALIYRGKNV